MTGKDLVPKVLKLSFWLALFLCSTGVVEATDHPAFEPVKALFADSEAINPSGAPLPSFSGAFEKFFCCE